MAERKQHRPGDGPYLAAIEAGGTKFNCAIFSVDGDVVAETRIPTTEPDETLSAVLAFFGQHAEKYGPFPGAGIASFGPLDLDPASATFGSIVSTPKPGWSGTNIRNTIREGLGTATLLDTDVNCAALAEGRFGAARDCSTHCYITIGTGIGVGIIANGESLGGTTHPELGHTRLPRAPGDTYQGLCPYHEDCVEGLACGPAMADRWGERPETLSDEHSAWDMEAHYVAALCFNIIYTVRPEKIVIGGGVFERKMLYGRVRQKLSGLLAGYALTPAEQDLESLVCAPGITETAPGLLGAFALAGTAAGLDRGGRHVD